MNLDDLRDSKDAAWSVAKVATLLHLDARTVRRACETEQIPSLKIGVRILIPTEYLRKRFLAAQTDDMSADPATTGPSTATTHQDFGGPSNAQNTELRSA